MFLPAIIPLKDEITFKSDMEFALSLAGSENLITFGINPTFPSTGFGYVKVNSEKNRLKTVLEFTEKPDKKLKQSHLLIQEIIIGILEYLSGLLKLF